MKKTIAVFALALSALSLTGCTDEEEQRLERVNAYEDALLELGIQPRDMGIMFITANSLCDRLDDMPEGSQRGYELMVEYADERVRLDDIDPQLALVAMTEAPTKLCPQHAGWFD